jgi:hypothetical protein
MTGVNNRWSKSGCSHACLKGRVEAVAALRNDGSGKMPPVDSTPPSSALSARPDDRAERRQVTVMFSDLAGSTALSPAWTLKTSARSFQPIKSALPKPCGAWAAL